MSDSIPYQAFFSYTRADNSDYDNVVDRLKSEVAGRFEAATGSRLEIFFDRESIGWGENWRDKIADAITGSTLFIPIVSMRYFNSEMCREELSAFLSAATQRNASDLVLPVVLAGASRIRSPHPDELVAAIADLNWQPIQDEFEAGYESAAWKGRIGKIVRGLEVALERSAESVTDIAPATRSAITEGVTIDEIDEQTIVGHLEAVTNQFEILQPLMERLGKATTERLGDRDISKMTPGQRNFFFNALADDIRESASDFGEHAATMEREARQADAEIRTFLAELRDIDPNQARQGEEELRLASEGLQGVAGAIAQLAELQQILRLVALGSVRLRKTLTPMSSGLRAMTTVMSIFESWQRIGE